MASLRLVRHVTRQGPHEVNDIFVGAPVCSAGAAKSDGDYRHEADRQRPMTSVHKADGMDSRPRSRVPNTGHHDVASDRPITNRGSTLAHDFRLYPEQIRLDRDGSPHSPEQRGKPQHMLALDRGPRDARGLEPAVVFAVLQAVNHGLRG
jgi:hypothetical protein